MDTQWISMTAIGWKLLLEWLNVSRPKSKNSEDLLWSFVLALNDTTSQLVGRLLATEYAKWNSETLNTSALARRRVKNSPEKKNHQQVLFNLFMVVALKKGTQSACEFMVGRCRHVWDRSEWRNSSRLYYRSIAHSYILAQFIITQMSVYEAHLDNLTAEHHETTA